jgi:hypothetical protein
MSSTKAITFLSLLCIFIKTPITLPPIMCPLLCLKDRPINQNCTCIEDKFCIAFACPSMDKRHYHRNCQCFLKDEFLQNKPIIYESIECEPWEEMNSKCKCEAEKILRPMSEDLTVIPQKCPISKCDNRFQLDKKSCSCRKWKGGICFIGCPEGQRVFAMPNRVNCECTYPPQCPITQCEDGYSLIHYECKEHIISDVKFIESGVVSLDSPLDDSVVPICGIKQCNKMYELFKQSCECRLENLSSCEEGCPVWKMIKPGTCRCVKKPYCQIKSCRKGFRLNKKKCSCNKRRKRKREYDY